MDLSETEIPNCKHFDWEDWHRFFAGRATRPLPALCADHEYHRLPESLARSIAVFQLGESGGGTVVEEARRSRLPGIDDHYAEALGLFVEEEHRHANVLAICVRLMGGELLRENWTAKLFVRGRRLLGLRLKIMVLMAAEVVGLTVYRAIAERLPPGSMQDWLGEIVRDEALHLEFHAAFLRRQVRGPIASVVFRAAWRALAVAARLAVSIDHRRMFRDMVIDPAQLREEWRRIARRVEERVLQPETGAAPSEPTAHPRAA